MLNNTRIILVNTSHPGNIGAAARAMKTMGLKELYLVDPYSFPHEKAVEMAVSAGDILEKAVAVKTLEEAIADCTLVIGTSARSRTVPWPMVTPREMAAKVKAEPQDAKTAIVFGREHSGLTNEELQLCHAHVQIPADPEYSSLNLAAAVQVIAYELRMASLEGKTSEPEWDYRLATAQEMDLFFAHLEKVSVQIDFLKPSAPRKLMTRLRRLYLRARPDVMEMNILRGMLTAIEDTIAKKD
jgi:tRNA (cytidine32/uridine32-2'-O)-methyltransferase